MKLDASAYFRCEKDYVKSVKHPQEPDILQKNVCFNSGNKTRV